MPGKVKLVVNFFSDEARKNCYAALLLEQGFSFEIEQYDLQTPLGSHGGEQTSVIRGKHLITKKSCAIKVFYLPSASYHYRSVPELELRARMQSLKHLSGITKMVEVIQQNEYVYLIMKLMNRNTLQDFMRSRSTLYLTIQDLQMPAYELVGGLAAIHKVGFVHGDI